MAEIYQLPENSGNNGGFGNIPFSIPIGGFGMGGGLFGGNYGMNGIADLFGLAIIASMFGWNGGGFGNGGFGGGYGGAAYVANQLSNDSGRELLMNAITAQGESSRTAIQNLATMIGQDFNLVNAAVQNVQSALSTLAMQQAVSVPQIINSIQSGDAALSRQLCECCCENRLLATQQGYQSQIRTIEQTNQLGSQADRNTASIVGAINSLHTDMTREFCEVKEREMQDKIDTLTANNALLRTQIDNANQTTQIAALIAPVQAKVNEIEARQPNTVPITWPNLTAVNNTPYVGGFGYGYGWNGFGNGIAF